VLHPNLHGGSLQHSRGPIAGFKGLVGTSEGGGRDGRGGTEEEEVTGEGEEDVRGGREGTGAGKGRRRGREGGNLAPTVMSKSRHL